MILKKLAVAAAFTLSMGLVGTAQADYIEALSETFASGATFTGTVTFDNNFVATAISGGVLTGYSLGTVGYVGGSASESINWIQDTTFNYSAAPLASNFLLDAASVPFDPSINNSLLFTIDFTNTSAPVFYSPLDVTYNGINSGSSISDALVSGTVNPVPVPAAVWLFASGFAGMGWFGRQKSVAV